MKKIRLYITAFLLVSLFAVSCDKDFDEINTSKTDFATMDPVFVMNTAINAMTNRSNANYLCQTFAVIQWMVTPFGAVLGGANYNQWTAKQDDPWATFYQNAVPNIVYTVNSAKADAAKSNLYNAARIWKVYVFQQITDAYGDVPYTQGGLGYPDQIMTPVYDTQQSIYMDMLKELDEASAALDKGKGAITGEVLYGGDVEKWKKFGYSLLLRTAMRLSKVDPATAETYVKKAVEGGLMGSNDDNAWYKHTSEFQNTLGVWLSGNERANIYATKAFVDFLKSTNDPRMVFLHRYEGAANASGQTTNVITKDPAKQIGMPMGFDNASIPPQVTADGLKSLYDYSQFDWRLFFINTSPEFHCTYGQTQLLLAEAILRGWASGDASVAFENAVRANMSLLAMFNSAGAVSATDINTYVADHPLNTSTTEAALEQINNEYWVGSIPNATEAWANFRRSGYPALTPNPYPASEIPGEFVRRHIYPEREQIANIENYNAAVSRMGGDKMNTRIWWDKE
jgi:hypothetical protein